jgi:ribosome-binding protein aMBF1 (putative translation factor)
MPRSSELDATSSLVAFFANELAIRRTAAGMSQSELANELSYSPSMIVLVETPRRFPRREFVVADP